MKITRRFFVAASGAFALAAAACSTLAQNVSQAASYASSIASGLQKVLPQIGSITGIAATKVAQIGQDIAQLQTAAANLAASASTAQGAPIATQIIALVEDAISALAAVPVIPAPISTAFEAASVLLPLIASAFGVTLPASLAAKASASAMTPAQAQAYLDGLK